MTNLEKMKEEWLSSHPLSERFVTYFYKYKAEIIGQTMTAELRSMAGLGWPPGIYAQNGNECINSVLQREKQLAGKRKLSIPEFASLLQTMVEGQRTENDPVFIGLREMKMNKT